MPAGVVPDGDPSASHADALKRLRWRCRRGMKEIDALLLRYLDQAGATVPLASMDALLETQDDVLWQWLLGRQVPDDAALAELIACIRSAAQASEH